MHNSLSDILAHTVIVFDWWALLALIVLIGTVLVFFIRHRKMKKEEKDYGEIYEPAVGCLC